MKKKIGDPMNHIKELATKAILYHNNDDTLAGKDLRWLILNHANLKRQDLTGTDLTG